MALVDTSIWIQSLANRTPFVAELDRLLSRCGLDRHSPPCLRYCGPIAPWTADRRFSAVGNELGVAYTPPLS